MKMKQTALALLTSLSLAPIVTYAGEEDTGLDTFMKDYHPDSLEVLAKEGIDFRELEERWKPFDDNLTDIAVGTTRYCSGILLANNYIATCVNNQGTFGNSYNSIGMTYNPAASGTITAPDFLRPGSPFEYFSVYMDGERFVNNNYTSSGQMPTGIKSLDRYSGYPAGVYANSTATSISNPYKKLSINQIYSLDPNSSEIIIETEITNIGKYTVSDIRLARGLDPDQDVDNYSQYKTLNFKGYTFYNVSPAVPIDVQPSNIALAEGKGSKLYTALYSIDPVKHNTCISSNWTTDPVVITDGKCLTMGDTSFDRLAGDLSITDYSDSTINIGFYAGSLTPGQKIKFSYRYMFGSLNTRRFF